MTASVRCIGKANLEKVKAEALKPTFDQESSSAFQRFKGHFKNIVEKFETKKSYSSISNFFSFARCMCKADTDDWFISFTFSFHFPHMLLLLFFRLSLFFVTYRQLAYHLLYSFKECAKSWCDKNNKSEILLKQWISEVSHKIKSKTETLKLSKQSDFVL